MVSSEALTIIQHILPSRGRGLQGDPYVTALSTDHHPRGWPSFSYSGYLRAHHTLEGAGVGVC